MRRLLSASHGGCSELVLAGVAGCASVRLIEAGACEALRAALLRRRLLEACEALLAALLERLVVTVTCEALLAVPLRPTERGQGVAGFACVRRLRFRLLAALPSVPR